MSKPPGGERNYSVAKILKTKQKSGHENNIMKLRQQAFPIFFHTLSHSNENGRP